jgi:hypothetical protein
MSPMETLHPLKRLLLLLEIINKAEKERMKMAKTSLYHTLISLRLKANKMTRKKNISLRYQNCTILRHATILRK